MFTQEAEGIQNMSGVYLSVIFQKDEAPCWGLRKSYTKVCINQMLTLANISIFGRTGALPHWGIIPI